MSYDLYRKVCFDISGLITKSYSTSFGLAVSTFDKETMEAITSVYGFVRLADEIADSFEGYDKAELFSEIRAEIKRTRKNRISLNPVINSFYLTVNKYNIPDEYIFSFLSSMEMDIKKSYYCGKEYDTYVYGSAEVVGLMCLKVFCKDNLSLFEKLVGPARALGSAFQKVNFLRDIKSDLMERGRIYLRGIGKKELINNLNKKLLEDEIEREFEIALTGIKKLPSDCAPAVYSAYLYYISLFRKIKKMDIEKLLSIRVRISNLTKLRLMMVSLMKYKIQKSFG